MTLLPSTTNFHRYDLARSHGGRTPFSSPNVSFSAIWRQTGPIILCNRAVSLFPTSQDIRRKSNFKIPENVGHHLSDMTAFNFFGAGSPSAGHCCNCSFVPSVHQ